MRTDLDYARELDDRDPLARFRSDFVNSDRDLIYLDGNSLGRLPRRTAMRMHEVVEREWGDRLIRGWNEGWYRDASRIGAKIASIIGADEDEVIIADSTSVNLFKLVVAALRVRPDRHEIVTDALNFPSDLYVMQGAAEIAVPRRRVCVVPSADGMTIDAEGLYRTIHADTALVSLTHTAFKSGFVHDMAAITQHAHAAGALVLWDLCHSAGVIPIELKRHSVDLAVGCTYKYLNGGPGAPAFLYVRRDWQEQLLNPIWGWFGQRAPFEFSLTYEPASGIDRFLAGTPPVLSLSAVEPGVDLVLEAGVDRLRAKSVLQTEYLIALWQEWLQPLGVELQSPREPDRRGSHVSLGHPEGLRIAKSLIDDMRVLPDFRAPDNIRFGVAPLYTSFCEIHEAMQRLRRVIESRMYERHSSERLGVT
jgi:kynureninase